MPGHRPDQEHQAGVVEVDAGVAAATDPADATGPIPVVRVTFHGVWLDNNDVGHNIEFMQVDRARELHRQLGSILQQIDGIADYHLRQ